VIELSAVGCKLEDLDIITAEPRLLLRLRRGGRFWRLGFVRCLFGVSGRGVSSEGAGRDGEREDEFDGGVFEWIKLDGLVLHMVVLGLSCGRLR